jgi:glucose-1-phosphate adenylyltransferase
VNSYADVDSSILFEGVDVGRHAVIRRAIIDKGVVVPPGARVGVDPDVDRARELTVTDSGITVVSAVDGWKLEKSQGT